jgi:hypothetical protein
MSVVDEATKAVPDVLTVDADGFAYGDWRPLAYIDVVFDKNGFAGAAEDEALVGRGSVSVGEELRDGRGHSHPAAVLVGREHRRDL